jgi:hypothetical protein
MHAHTAVSRVGTAISEVDAALEAMLPRWLMSGMGLERKSSRLARSLGVSPSVKAPQMSTYELDVADGTCLNARMASDSFDTTVATVCV